MQPNAFSEVLILVGFLLLVLWIVVRIAPPKGINALYGYRTPRSLKDLDSWNHAQALSNQLMFRLAFTFLLVGLVFLYIDISHWSAYKTLGLALAMLLLGFGTMIFTVEKSLRRTFPKEPVKTE